MAAIDKYFDKSIIIYRARTTTGFKKNLMATATIDAQIQRIQDTDTLEIYGVQGVLYRAWIDISDDVKEGDTIQDEDGNRYSAIAVEYLNQDFAMNEHKEVIMEEYHARVKD